MPERDIRIRIFIQDENIAALEKMAGALQGAARAEKTLHNEALKKNKAIKKQADVVDKDGKALDDVNKKTRTWTQQIVKNIGKVLEWAVATGIIFGAIRTLRTSVEDIIDVEFAMAGLTKVMLDGERRSKMLRSELLALGQQYGELGEDVVNASTEWARLQISTIEIAENAEVALLAQAVAEMQVVDATNYLIASMQQFERTTFENIRTLDQWNELSNRMAVRAQDLAASTARAGSVIHNAGDSMEFLNGVTAALVQATKRSGQEIGNAIRTFGTYTYRLRSVTQLESLGIQIRNKQTGSLRSFGDVMTQTAIKWDTFSDTQQRAIAQAIAGTRRQNEFITLMREFPEVLNAAVIASESFGSAEKEAAILLDTAQKKAQQFRAGLQRLAAEFGNTGPLKSFLDVLNGLINALIEYKSFVIPLTVVMGIFATKAIIVAISFTKLWAAVRAAGAAFAMLNPWIIAATAAAIAAGFVWHNLRTEISFTADELVKAAQKEVGTIKGLEARADRLEFLIEKYKELQKAQEGGFAGDLSGSLKSTAQEINLIGKNLDEAFDIDIGGLDAAQKLLDKMEQSTGRARKGRQAILASQIEALQRRVRFGDEYVRQLSKTSDKEEAFGKAFDIVIKKNVESIDTKMRALRETGFVGKRMGKLVAAGAGDAKENLDALKAVVLTLEGLFGDLQKQVEIKAPLFDFMEIDEIKRRIESLNEATRHRAAMAEIAGATELNGLLLTSNAIGKHIGLVKEQVSAYNEAGEDIDKLVKLLNDLEAQLQNVNNKIIETRKAEVGAGIEAALTKRITIIENAYAAQIKLADGVKDSVKSAELQIRSLQEQANATRLVIGALNLFRVSSKDLSEDLEGLNAKILLETQILNLLIRPLQQAKEKSEALKQAEKEFAAVEDSVNAATERNITTMKAYGATEKDIAKLRVVAAQQLIALAKSHNLSAEAVRELSEALKDMQVALATTPDEEIMRGLNAQQDARERQINIIKALGATDVQVAQQRLANLRQHKQEIESSLILEVEKKQEVIAIDKEIKDAENEVKVASIEAAQESADAWIKAYEKRYDAWARLIGRGISKKGILDTLERIQQEMVDRWIRTAFEPIIKRLTDWEFTMLGVDPEQMRLQEENRNKQLQVLQQGGNAIFNNMKAGGDYAANAIGSAMQVSSSSSAAMVSVPGSQTGRENFTWASQAYSLGNEGGGGFSAGGTALSLAPFVLNNMDDWATGRGGGVRLAGAGIGGIAAGILSGGNPAAISFGAQAGNELVAAIQGLGDKLDNNTEALRPGAETLREQIGGAINRGTFGSAASITYNQVFNINNGFLIPDREATRRATAIIKQELQSQNVNVNVGG